MSSRVDRLTNFVDDLEQKTNSVLRCIEESNNLIFKINYFNQEITEADFNLESLVDSYSKNVAYLSRSHGLHEKLFYLESNLHINDNITNQNSYNNLLIEYQNLTQDLETPIVMTDNNLYEETSDEQKFSSEMSTPSLSQPISISNLKLKPIRCKSTKIYKKKSRYRLSNIYNLNPIAYDDWYNYDDSEESIEVTSRKISENTDNSSTTNIMDDDNSNDSYDTSITTSPSIYANGIMNSKTNLQASTIDYSINSTKFQYSNSLNGEDDIRSSNDKESEISHNEKYLDESNELNLDIEPEYDNISIYSDISDLSPSRKKCGSNKYDEKIDNFEKYLRESRVDLSKSFPHIIKKARSHDSLFSYKSIEKEEKPSFKFHNPIDNIPITAKTSKPTIESIFYNNKQNSITSTTNANTRKILNEVILKNDSKFSKESKELQSPISKSFKANFSIFNFSGSPKVSRKRVEQSNYRRNSLENIGSTLTDSFLNLVQAPKIKGCDSKTLKPKKVSRDHVLKPKKNPQEHPIIIKNETQMKRLPIRVPPINGYHSNLVIGPNNTRIINHGESSVFRKPIMSPVRHNTLKDALSQSLI